MTKQWATIPLWLAAGWLAACAAPTPGVVERNELGSQNVDETFQLLVHLPPAYEAEPERRFPVVYQLDPEFAGLRQFERTVRMATRLAAAGTLPPVIVVGVGYPYDDTETKQRGRWRDYSFPVAEPRAPELYGYGAEAFARFLADELVPHIDARYRTDTAQARTLIGHSLGGLFVLYTLCRSPSTPIFGRLVAASASYPYESAALFEQEAALAARTEALPIRLFVSVGQIEGLPQNVYFDRFVERIRERQHEGLIIEAVRLGAADHLDTIVPSVERGLIFSFGDAQ